MSKLVGNYVEDVAYGVVAGIISRNHVGIVSKPGTGKTTICNDVATRIFGDDAVMSRFSPTTGPEVVEGRFDMKRWLEGNEIAYLTENTPYQAGCKVWIADEAPRANTAILDMFVKVLDEWNVDRRMNGGAGTSGPVVIATANFLPKGERTEAFLDRLGLMIWLETPTVDVREIVRAQAAAMTGGIETGIDLPDRAEIEAVWMASPTDRAIDAVAETIAMVDDMARKGLTNENGEIRRVFSDLNNRRYAQWTTLLSRVTMLYGGTADFTAVHPQALRALRYAWQSRSYEEARDWAELISTVADPVTAMVNNALASAYDVFQRIAASGGRDAIAQLGAEMAKAAENIRRFVREDDPRYIDATTQLNDTFSRIFSELTSKGK